MQDDETYAGTEVRFLEPIRSKEQFQKLRNKILQETLNCENEDIDMYDEDDDVFNVSEPRRVSEPTKIAPHKYSVRCNCQRCSKMGKMEN